MHWRRSRILAHQLHIYHNLTLVMVDFSLFSANLKRGGGSTSTAIVTFERISFLEYAGPNTIQ
jgi:hypothetical protein